MPDGQSIAMLFVALFLVFLNGFFVLSEFAIVKVRRTKLEELEKKGQANAKLALKITSSLDSYLSATQLGITISSLALGWIGEPAVARLLHAPLSYIFSDNITLVKTASFVVAFSFITLIHVVAGELIPKSIAIARAEKATLSVSKPLYIFWIIFYPLIRMFDIIASFFLRKIGIVPAGESETAHSDEEIKLIINESEKGGFIDSFESEIIQNAVNFSDTVAKEIMTPRKGMICLYEEDDYEENIKTVIETKHTRYPYCIDGKDNIIGIIHIRDLLTNEYTNRTNRDFKKIVRPMICVPENMSISKILFRMNKEQIHTSVVIDEFGGTAGLLTMEDILEEIIGDISDEHDTKSIDYKELNENTFEFDGMFDMESVCEVLDYEFEDIGEILTIGGRIFNILGRPPIIGDTLIDGIFEFKILEVDGNRVKKLLCTRVETPKIKHR